MSNNFAHSLPGQPEQKWQPLSTHLNNVAQQSGLFAQEFGMGGLAYLLGYIHDVGKASSEFQQYLLTTQDSEEPTNEDHCTLHHKGPDHSTAGAQWLNASIPGLGILLAYAVAGHHSGLPDGISGEGSALSNRLKKAIPQWQTRCDFPMPDVKEIQKKAIQEIRDKFTSGGFSLAFCLRMLFSCLVDADFLDTENFMDPEHASERGAKPKATLQELLSLLEKHYETLDERTEKIGRQNDSVMIVRNEVRHDCAQVAEKAQGLFTLQVPTGGGKTLASMLFALKHAVKNKQDRIIFVIPFTTIIEQTAKVYQDIFGEENVLEVHSNIDPDDQTLEAKLLAENWDAPIIVTTNVQFFESLFSNRTSRCRKLHNIANAVIVFDEAQTLPIDLLKPCLKAMEELMKFYHSSIVLCTATLPIFTDVAIFGNAVLKGGSNGITDIIPPERSLHERLKRVRVEKLQDKVSDDAIVEQLATEKSALIVVSTRRHARDLFLKAKEQLINTHNVFHLSAQMCGVHRSAVLGEVRKCLDNRESCILISTQLIEAGVDIDFPCVYREIAGIDSMAQAAGRCNREGRLAEKGRVVLFESMDYDVPRGFLREAAQEGRLTTLLPEVKDDLLGPEAVNRYFTALYFDRQKGNPQGMDKYAVLTDLIPENIPRNVKSEKLLVYKFKELGKKFRLIDNCTCDVIVPFEEEGKALCEQLRKEFAPSEQRRLARKLQRYTVSMGGTEPIDENGHLMATRFHDAYWILDDVFPYYDENLGLQRQLDTSLLTV